MLNQFVVIRYNLVIDCESIQTNLIFWVQVLIISINVWNE